MSNSKNTARSRTRLSDRVIEVMAVILLAVATLGSAWCGYQASRWNSEETDLARRASDARVEASREFGLATQRVAYDSSIVSDYAQALSAGDEPLMAFYRTALIRPEFLPIIEQWQAEIAAGEEPANLVENEEYLNDQLSVYRTLEAQADEALLESDEAGEESDDYVLTTLLLASALFFAGVTTSFRVRVPRLLLLAGSALVIAYAASRLAALSVV